MDGLKTCIDCNEDKPLDSFNKDKSRKDGYREVCKPCRSESRTSTETKERRALEANGLAKCTNCHETKSIDRFRTRVNHNGYLCRDRKCLDCEKSYDTQRARKRMYGLSPEAYQEMLEAQAFKCANTACDGPAECVDHDHSCCPGKTSCGKCVKGILCRGCNLAEGMLAGDANRALGLAEYIIMTRRSDLNVDA